MEELCKTVCSDFETLWINHLKWPAKFTIYPIKFKNKREKGKKQLKNKSITKWKLVESSKCIKGGWQLKYQRELSWAGDWNLHMFWMALQEGKLESRWRSPEKSNGEDRPVEKFLWLIPIDRSFGEYLGMRKGKTQTFMGILGLDSTL